MCAGPVPSGANFSTSPVGPHTFTVDAADVAGNPAQKTHTYTVVFELVAFASSRDGNFEIYSMNGDGSSPTRLTANPAADGVLQRSGCRCSCILTRGGRGKFEKWLVQRFPGPRNAGEIKKYGGRVAPTEYGFALFSSMLPHVYQTGG
jgi:hypothetical protein